MMMWEIKEFKVTMPVIGYLAIRLKNRELMKLYQRVTKGF
jgi:hypothetical protein